MPPTTRQLAALNACLRADCDKAAAADLGVSYVAFRSLLHRLYRDLSTPDRRIAHKAQAVAALDDAMPGWRAVAA
jgi:hypothetical protein